MEDKVKELLDGKLDELNMVVDSVVLEKEGSQTFLRICLDSEDIIDLDKVVLATKIIDPIIENADLINEQYILEVYGKSKGSNLDEKKN
ncbi:MAG: hypothetical protein IJ501_04505 [Bacilli bacterium]|nr:hypothetical protein [Bacilli bacterium]